MSTDAGECSRSNHKSCSDPFKCHKQLVRKGLRVVTDAVRRTHSFLKLGSGDRLCTACRKRISTLPQTTEDALAMELSTDTLSESEGEFEFGVSDANETIRASAAVQAFVSPEHELSLLNSSLHMIEESPLVKRKINTRVNYVKDKVSRIHTSVKRKIELITGSALDEEELMEEEDSASSQTEIIDQLKEKFKLCMKTSEKVQILTVLPKSWSIRKIENEFETSNYLVRKAKRLVEEKGVLSTPNPKAGKSLSKKIVDDIKNMYCCDTISRQMPGMKDTVSVIVDNKRENKQKRLILCNLREVFEQFKQRHPEHKVGFSKFAELRPRQCVLAGAAGTHSVCVCTIHQNMKLMFEGARLDRLATTAGDSYSYHNCLAEILCNPPRIQCFGGYCAECPGVEHLQERLEHHFDEQSIDRIEVKQWTTTDRSTLETKVQSADDFIRFFIAAIPKVVHHDFVAKQQSNYIQDRKRQLIPGEFLVIGDFAENYSFVVQDAAQSFHWNNLQATLHPFVCYYREEELGKENDSDHHGQTSILKHVSFVIVSESNIHDTVAVHLFQKVLLNFLAQRVNKPKKIIYFSDGCAAQYKNRKNFVNLCHHEQDFGMPAEWHFFATSHGKGPCDGVGGTVKRLAARASLQRPVDNQILTPRHLFEFAQSEITSINFYYATAVEYEKEETLLRSRFESSRTIAGTHKLHSIIPISKELVEVREFSISELTRVECVTLSSPAASIGLSVANLVHIKGYITAKYDGHWWLGCVLKTIPESEEVEISFLHPHGPSRSFKFPTKADILVMSCEDILTAVSPTTVTGRSYTLSEAESLAATERLAVK